jgi:hypothetical protein
LTLRLADLAVCQPYAATCYYYGVAPDACSLSISFTVSALGVEAPSLPSEVLTHTTSPCEVTAIAKLLSLNIYGTVDDEYDCLLRFFPAQNCYAYDRECEGYDALGWLTAEGMTYQRVDIGVCAGDVDLVWPVNRYGQDLFYPHSLALMTEENNIFTVLLDPANPVLEITADFLDLDDIQDDTFCSIDSRELDLPFHLLSSEE